jgi:hypothetical protein
MGELEQKVHLSGWFALIFVVIEAVEQLLAY